MSSSPRLSPQIGSRRCQASATGALRDKLVLFAGRFPNEEEEWIRILEYFKNSDAGARQEVPRRLQQYAKAEVLDAEGVGHVGRGTSGLRNERHQILE